MTTRRARALTTAAAAAIIVSLLPSCQSDSATTSVPPNLNTSLGITLPAYWGGHGPTMLTTQWPRIAQYASLLPITVITSSCCWPATAERTALQHLREAGVQLVFYVPLLDPRAYKQGKILCCDNLTNIARHTSEVFNETADPLGHTGIGPTDGIFYDNGPFVGQEQVLPLAKVYEFAQSKRKGAPIFFNSQGPAAVNESYLASLDLATFIAFESFPRYWSSRWFDNRSHTFDWGVYPARRFGMFTENASTKSQMMQSIDAAVALNVGRFYVTDQIGRYDRLPTYWDELVHYIADKNEQRGQTVVVEAGAL
jgi:hypothetical protein